MRSLYTLESEQKISKRTVSMEPRKYKEMKMKTNKQTNNKRKKLNKKKNKQTITDASMVVMACSGLTVYRCEGRVEKKKEE